MKKAFALLSIFYIVFFLLAVDIQARLLPRFRSVKKSSGQAVYSGVGVSARLRGDRRALNLYFSNLSAARNVTYTLIYQTDGKEEGARGSIDSSGGNTASRELLFGTCSAGVCRYHANLKNMRLEVITELLSGKKTIKRFRIRV